MTFYKGVIPKKPHPELFAKLAAAIPDLPANDKTFALSLHDGHVKYGGWSEKQAMWAQKMIDKAAVCTGTPLDVLLGPSVPTVVGVDLSSTPDQTAMVVASASEYANIQNLFVTAAAHLKSPSIKLLTAKGKQVVIKVNKKTNLLNVVSDGSYPNKWYGKVTANGEFQPKFGLDPNFVTDITDMLKALAANPAGVAAEYGKLHGKCCFCSKGLTDEKSTSVGYGPICAQHYGLPWGDVKNGYSTGGNLYAKGKSKIQEVLEAAKASGAGVVVTSQDSMKLNLYTSKPSGALHEELKEEAAAAKEPGEKMVPVLSEDEFKRMQEKVEILF